MMKLSAAVIIYNQYGFLLLQRTMPPLIWAPPSGGVLPGETLVAAAIRETQEETGLRVSDLLPVEVWTGDNAGELATAVTFITKVNPATVTLSAEHDAYQWVSLAQLEQFAPHTTFALQAWGKYAQLYEYYRQLNHSEVTV